MRKFFKKALLMALSTVLTGIGAMAICNVNDEQPTLTAVAETEETVMQAVVGLNSVEFVDVGEGVKMKFDRPGTYRVDWAENETNGWFFLKYGDSYIPIGDDLIPQEVTISYGQTLEFAIFSKNLQVDTIDFVITQLFPEWPAQDSTLTVTEVLTLDLSNYADQKYYIEGVVTRYVDTYSGVFFIADENGNEICVNGLQKTSASGNNKPFDRFSYGDKPRVDATIKVYAGLSSVNGEKQLVGATVEELVQPSTDIEGDFPKNGSTLTIPEILNLDVTNSTLRVYKVKGTVKSVEDATFGKLYIEDEAGNILYIDGLYDSYSGVRYDEILMQPHVKDFIKVESTISKVDGQNRLVNARLLECTKAPLSLNLNGETVINIPAGNATTEEYVYVNAEAIADTENAQFTISWDETITQLVVNRSVVSNGDIITAQNGVVHLEFNVRDFSELSVVITLVPYVPPRIPELVGGINSIAVEAGERTAMQISVPGEYGIMWAAGEFNGVLFIEKSWGPEWVEVPYNKFTVAEGEVVKFLISTANGESDTIDLELFIIHDCVDNDSNHKCDICEKVLSACETYTDATCQEPAKCIVCGAAKDETLANHNYVDGVCSVCGGKEATVTPEQPADSVETEPKEEPSITDKVTDIIPESVKNMIPGCSGVVGGIAGGLTALGVATLALLKKKED